MLFYPGATCSTQAEHALPRHSMLYQGATCSTKAQHALPRHNLLYPGTTCFYPGATRPIPHLKAPEINLWLILRTCCCIVQM